MSYDVKYKAHSSVQKAANMAALGTSLRIIPTSARGQNKDEAAYAMDAASLATAMREDAARGLTPMFVSANVGSTNTCAIDPVRALGEVCRR